MFFLQKEGLSSLEGMSLINIFSFLPISYGMCRIIIFDPPSLVSEVLPPLLVLRYLGPTSQLELPEQQIF